MYYVVDRFEGEWAMLEDADGHIRSFPKTQMPIGVKEGDVLREEAGTFILDEQETQRRAEHIRLKTQTFWKSN